MKALIYQGPGKKALEDRPAPEIIHPTDAVIKIAKAVGHDVAHKNYIQAIVENI